MYLDTIENSKKQINKKSIKKVCTLFLPFFSILFCLGVNVFIPLNPSYLNKEEIYLTVFSSASAVMFFVFAVISLKHKEFGKKYEYKAPFIAGIYLFLTIYNIVTAKMALLPVIYFPYPDKILAVFIKNREILLKSVFYSTRLQLMGLFFGISSGLMTGVTIGWSKRINYWLHPIIKILGPIPATAWIPIALVAFPSSLTASIFMVSLSVWFPVTVLTSSGIQNVEQSYFEVARTLGASNMYQIFRIAIPAAMPSIFVGVFNGVCASFLALMSAEMLGVKYGIGWYLNWQREVMSYPSVYAALIIIAVFCYFFVTLLFRFRDKMLIWQKGIIKW